MSNALSEQQEIIQKHYQTLQNDLSILKADFDKIMKGEEQAAKRARMGLLAARVSITDLRMQILTYMKTRKTQRKKFTYL